ncbi:protein zwilch homolog isoform X2 [Dysidea avara]
MLCEHETGEVLFKKPIPIMKGLSVRSAPKHKHIIHSAIDYHGTVATDLRSLKCVADLVSLFKEKHKITDVDTQVFAEYGLGSGEEGRDHQIVLEYVFSNPEHVRCPPPTTADTTVKISLTPGGTLSPVLSVYQELSSLLSLLKISEGGSEWPESESPDGYTNPVSCGTFIEKIKVATFNYATVMEDTIASPSIVNTIFPVRTDIDFCDMVWLFVKDSQSMDDLRKTLGQIAGAVFDHLIQPIIDTSNNAPLAKLFRKAVVCSNPEEQVLLRSHLKDLLSTEKVVQSLVELGLGKLVKDYVNYFTIHELATKSQLSYYLQADSTITIREQCDRLSKLHCIAELTSYILNQLPMAMPGQLTQSALQIYPSLQTGVDSYDKEATPLFNIQLTAHPSATRSAVNLCSSLQPLVWTLLLTEHNKETPSNLWIVTEQALHCDDTANTTIELDNILHVYQSRCESVFL